MSLKNLSFATETIKAAGGEFAVRGLSLADLTRLVRRHGRAMSEFFDRMASSGNVDLERVAVMGSALAEAAPELAAEIIAVAADEPELVDTALRLPFPVQIEALEKIALLTFETEGGAKKVVEAVIRSVSGVQTFLADLKT